MKYSMGLNLDFDLEYAKQVFVEKYKRMFEKPDPYHSYHFTAVSIDEDVGMDKISEQIGVKLHVQRYFRTKPNSVGPIHIDCKHDTGAARQWAINIPIMNCDNSTMEWFDHDQFGEFEWWAMAGFYRPPIDQMEDKNFTAVPIQDEKMVLNMPRLVETKTMHRVNNINNPHDRIVLSMRTDYPVTYEEIYERCKPLDSGINITL